LETLSGGRIELMLDNGSSDDPGSDVAPGHADVGLALSLDGGGRNASHALFSGVPFGLDGAAAAAWLAHGGGQALWDDIAAAEGLKPFFGGHGGARRGLWAERPVTALGGLPVAATGATALVLSALGAEVRADAATAAGIDPTIDLMLGRPSTARSLQAAALFSSGTQFAAIVRRELWDGLAADEKAILETAIESAALALTHELAAHSGPALAAIRARGVRIGPDPAGLWTGAREAAADVLSEIAASGPAAERLIASYRGFAAATDAPAPAGAAEA
jgi:TRAP-type mannitol/chloroaromatic compound transport system substrate-binding protein